jgi:hypothetical protein
VRLKIAISFIVVPRPTAPEARRKKQNFYRDEQDVQDKIRIILRFNQNFVSCLSCQSLLIDVSGFAVSLFDQSK